MVESDSTRNMLSREPAQARLHVKIRFSLYGACYVSSLIWYNLVDLYRS